MGDQKLSLPRVRVFRDGHDPLELQILNPDLLRWDVTRGRHRWPSMKDGPHLWMTFIAWAAAVRTGATEQKWETFRDSVLEVATVETDDLLDGGLDEDPDADGSGSADPFPAGPGPDY